MSIQSLIAGQTWGVTRGIINNNIAELDNAKPSLALAETITGDWNFGGKLGAGSPLFEYVIGGITMTAKTVFKGSTTGNTDLTKYSLILADSSDNPIVMFNNSGRMNLFDYSGDGGVSCLYNCGTPVDFMTAGHYAFGSKNDAGNLNTVAYVLANVGDVSANTMSSTLKLGIMVDKDTSVGYSQPNVFMTFSKLGLSVPIGADLSGTISLRGSLSILNKAENGWVTFATRYTAGAEAGYILENIVSLNLSNAIGVGVTTPEAFLHLKAGGTTAAPIKLMPGVVLASPQKGTIEYVDDGTTGHWYLTMSVAGTVTRKEIAFI